MLPGTVEDFALVHQIRQPAGPHLTMELGGEIGLGDDVRAFEADQLLVALADGLQPCRISAVVEEAEAALVERRALLMREQGGIRLRFHDREASPPPFRVGGGNLRWRIAHCRHHPRMNVQVAQRIRLANGMGCGGDLLPELAWCGYWSWSRQHPQALGRHAHGEHFELLCLFGGTLDWWVAGEQRTLNAGQVFVIHPGDEHDGIDHVRHRCDVGWFGLRPPLPGLPPGVAALITQQPPRPLTVDPTTLTALAAVLNEGSTRQPFTAEAVRTHLHRALIGVARAMQQPGDDAPRRSPAVEQATAILRKRLVDPPTIAALARSVGLGRSTLHERFVTELGLAPAEYLTQLRIERAKTLLPGATNTAVAGALGYASAQHFATVFRRATGMTPGAWRKR